MLTASEFLMREPLPLYRIQEQIFAFCRERPEVVVFGAQAVNIHVSEPRMSQDVDLLSADPRRTADELATALRDAFHMAVRVREVKPSKGYRVYQLADSPRHLAYVRLAEFPLDPSNVWVRDGVRYVSLPMAVAMKVCALASRRMSPRGATDLADLRRMLLAHPELGTTASGSVVQRIDLLAGGSSAHAAWAGLLAEPLTPDADEGY